MGDPSEECDEIEEDSNYYTEYSPQVENNTGKVSWILNKGWGIGKKLLMTGAVISSAPFVLPPLVVTSAIAFACWVPCGVVAASYACSEKIMSKLLPYNSNEDEEEFEDAEEGLKVDASECLDMEEKPLSEGINGRMEWSTYEYADDVLLDENAVIDGVDLVVINVIEGEDEFGVSPTEVSTSVVLEGKVGQENVSELLEEEELVNETRGLLEKIRDEGSAGNGMEMDIQYIDGTAGLRDSMDISLDGNIVGDAVDIYMSTVIEGEGEISSEETEEKEVVNDFKGDDEFVKETRGLLERIRDAGSADNAMVITKPYVEEIEQGNEKETAEINIRDFNETERAVDGNNIDADAGLEKPTSTIEAGFPKGSEKTEEKKHVTFNTVSEDWASVSERENADNAFRAERQIGEIRIVNNIPEAEKSMSEMSNGLTGVSTVVQETYAPDKNKEAILQANRAENNLSQGKVPLIRERETVVFTNADAREIADESGLYVFDEKNASGHVGGEGADVAELPISSRVNESTNAKISTRKNGIHSNGVLHNEDKIWKQIDAIRSIVGYKVTRHTSYMEELKALYIFTGVEPPTSFDDPADLAQVNNKLGFLMSIIGLK